MTKPALRTSSEHPSSPSHEMRNALACIQQFGSILMDGLAGELSGEQREYIGIMLENASKIRSVLDSELGGTDGLLKESKIKIERVSRLEN
jgi:signal transduction histidine kinase